MYIIIFYILIYINYIYCHSHFDANLLKHSHTVGHTVNNNINNKIISNVNNKLKSKGEDDEEEDDVDTTRRRRRQYATKCRRKIQSQNLLILNSINPTITM
eukprot:XP_765702.1 hypothetical protein [Theileria parva strain Muguga]